MANGLRGGYYLNFERERGIFTPRDRRFLAGMLDEELTENSKRQKRYQLRQRMIHAVQDLAYLSLMDTNDLLGVANELIERMRAEDPLEEPAPPEVERVSRGAEEIIALYARTLHMSVFTSMIRRELGTVAALQHYEETGQFGVFDVTVDVELEEEMPVSELLEVPTDELQQVGQYYGWYEVISEADPYARLENIPDIVRTVVAVTEELTEEDGEPVKERYPDEEKVVEVVAEREGVSESEAIEAVIDALESGRCYLPSEGKLRAVSSTPPERL